MGKYGFNDVKSSFEELIEEENKLTGSQWPRPAITAKEAYNTAQQLVETAYSSLLPRSDCRIYMNNTSEYVPESISGHTNLVQTLVDYFLCFLYGDNFYKTESGYNYHEIMEAIRRHDLPENDIGDLPDNGTSYPDKAKKEDDYWKKFSSLSPKRCSESEKRIVDLLVQMRDKSTDIGKMLYVADKASAIIKALTCDKIGYPITMGKNSPYATNRDKYFMKICEDRATNGEYYASEMWSIDYFSFRKIVNDDKFGYFTAIILMLTLMTKGKWYVWRKVQYHK